MIDGAALIVAGGARPPAKIAFSQRMLYFPPHQGWGAL